MKITKNHLKQIIKEELGRMLRERKFQPYRALTDVASTLSPALSADYDYLAANPATWKEIHAIQSQMGQEGRDRIRGTEGVGQKLQQLGGEMNPFYDPGTGRRGWDAYTPSYVSNLKRMRGEEEFPELSQTSPNPDTRTSPYVPELDQITPIEEATKVRRSRKK